MYEREMTEVRSSKQVEISEIDGRLQEQYQERLQSALQDLRDHYETQMKQNREEVESLYQTKVSSDELGCLVYPLTIALASSMFQVQDLEEQTRNQRSAASTAYEELMQSRNRVDGFTSRIAELESSNNSLKVYL